MKSKTAIIGAGRIAHSLCAAMVKKSYNVSIVISRNINSAKSLAKKIGIKNFSDDLSKLNKSINVFFLSVPDSEIKTVAAELSKCNLDFKNSLFIHLSGAENISKLNALKKKGAAVASLHLMQTFPSKKVMPVKGVHAAIETNDDKAYKFLKKLSDDIGLLVFKISSSAKVYYHLSGVYASNFLAGNLYNSEKLLNQAGINKHEAFEILSSTIYSTLKNVKQSGAANALSGPVDRGDVKTIKKHITALKKLTQKKPDNNYFKLLLNNYLVESLNLLNLVREKQGGLNKKHNKIEKLLVQELSELVNSN